MRAICDSPLLQIVLAAGLATSLAAAPLKTETAKKPCPAPAPAGKTQVAPAPQSAPSIRDLMEPGFGRKLLDLSLQAKTNFKASSKS
jgi:hypothetical protein